MKKEKFLLALISEDGKKLLSPVGETQKKVIKAAFPNGIDSSITFTAGPQWSDPVSIIKESRITDIMFMEHNPDKKTWDSSVFSGEAVKAFKALLRKEGTGRSSYELCKEFCKNNLI